MDERLPEGIMRVRANNPSPLTLDGTNTYVVAGWVVDPGPSDERHLRAVFDAAGAIEGIVLTHNHGDHSDGAPLLAEMTGAEVVRPRSEERVGPFEVFATPGHAPDHVSLLAGRELFTGDTVLGSGSVFIAPGEGSLSAYLESLRRLRELDTEAILPGHGPVVWDPRAKLDEYIEHRLERERLVLDALDAGARTRDELLDRAWYDVDFASAPYLRYAAAATLEAHLEKLEEEGRLPAGVEREPLAWP
jgi:glyoxylase-like metal-dependent hydrolase (beta-lactamase superfamily II)